MTGATLTKGTVCYINGASGNRPTVAKALATSDATSAQTFGLIQADIPNNSNGYLVAFGDLDGLNTSAFAEGVQLYLSATTAGTYTSVKQYAPNHLVYIGVVTRQHVNQGRIEVRIGNGFEMDELHDVAAQTPSNNDGLFYNSTNSLWENKSISTALGYTPANAATTLTINGVTFDLSTSRTFTVGSVTGSGASGQVAFWTGTSAQTGSNNLFWDNTSGFLGVGTNTPINPLHVVGSVIAIRASLANGDGCVISNDSTMSYFQALTAGNLVRDFNIAGKEIIFRSGSSSYSERFRLFSTGNLGINTGASDSGQRLQVQGTTLLNGNVTFSSATGMTWDAANGRLGIGTNAPANQLYILVNANQATSANFGLAVKNSNSTGYANTLWYNDLNEIGQFLMTGSGGAIAGTNIAARQANFVSTSANGVNIFAANATGYITLAAGNSSTSHVKLNTNGNFTIGSTTDSGERLQVTGTSKLDGNTSITGTLGISGTTTVSGNLLASTIYPRINQNIEISAPWADSVQVLITTITNKAQVLIVRPTANLTLTAGTHDTQRVTHTFAPTSGNGVVNALTLQQTINQTGGANGITRGLYVNPTLTAAADFRAIETTNGKVIFGNLPTSSAGLPTGAIWNDAGTIKIV
jgi:hypothetical protein